jgi:capsular polysaccharide export protein
MSHGTDSMHVTGPLAAHGFSWRKRPLVRSFAGRTDIRFVSNGRSVAPGDSLLLWGSAPTPMDLPENVQIVRLEDGFVRSVGLGADLTRPLSWVMDAVGIYYDATRPSALEHLLQNASFEPAMLQRAVDFRQRLVHAGLTKYNLAAPVWSRPKGHAQVVLVPGQVETDASIALGALDIRTNMGLLQAVRQARPEAWVVYKPHPDVVAGLRGTGNGEDQAGRYCDEVLLEGSMHDLLMHVDEVHVMTSLAGFEGLLRGRTVVCYGMPFYAGFGLTEDRHALPRRTRRLSLDQLVAGALLRYPTYLSRVTNQRCTPEQALDELLAWRQQRPGGIARWRKWLRPLLARQ